jgi:predicted nucleotidyltransferase
MVIKGLDFLVRIQEVTKTELSDLDFIVEFYKEKKNYKNFIHLSYFLEDIFNKKVDLLTLESLPKERKFTENVMNEVFFFI